MKNKMHRARQAVGLAIRIIISAVIIAVIIWKYNDLVNIDVRELIEASHSALAAVGSILGVYLLKSVLFVIPASIIYTSVGVAFESWQALLINAAGIIIEVSATWLLGRILGGNNVEKLLKKKKAGQKILAQKDKNKYYEIFGIRVLPVFPIDFVSLFLGASRMKFLPYLLLSFAGIAPRVALFTLLGDSIYDIIPMRYIIIGILCLVPVLLAVWVIRYCVDMNRREPWVYEPVSKTRRDVILDTDIGPDCDDAGAIAVLVSLLNKLEMKPLGIVNCTSNPYGNGVIKTLLSFFGAWSVPVAQTERQGFLPDEFKYNKPVTEKYFGANPDLSAIPAMEFYRDRLSNAQDDSVVLVSVGMLNNISDLLDTYPVLVEKKVHALISMACTFPKGREYNIFMDAKAAKNVFDNFPKPIICSGYEVGKSFKTGFETLPENALSNPLYDCYELYTAGDKNVDTPIRESWDLTTVLYAVEGDGEFFKLSDRVKISIDEDGNNVAKRDGSSDRYYIKKTAKDAQLAAYLNGLLRSFDDK